MPKPFVYTNGQAITVRALVVDSRDASYPVISIGGYHVPIPQLNLDAADQRIEGRELTQEEYDRAEARKHEDAEAAARAQAQADAAKAEEEPAAS